MTTVKARHLLLVLLLQAHGKQTASTLGQWLGVHERTIARYAHDLEQVDIKVRTLKGAHGGSALEPSARVRLGSFIRQGADDHTAASADEMHLRQQMRELIDLLPAPLRPAIHARLDQMVLENGPAGVPANQRTQLATLRRALWRGTRVTALVRHTPHDAEWRTMDPLVVTCLDDVWYVVSFWVDQRHLHAHALSDLIEVNLLDQPGEPPEALFARHPSS